MKMKSQKWVLMPLVQYFHNIVSGTASCMHSMLRELVALGASFGPMGQLASTECTRSHVGPISPARPLPHCYCGQRAAGAARPWPSRSCHMHADAAKHWVYLHV